MTIRSMLSTAVWTAGTALAGVQVAVAQPAPPQPPTATQVVVRGKNFLTDAVLVAAGAGFIVYSICRPSNRQ